jgi:hypothetical protein
MRLAKIQVFDHVWPQVFDLEKQRRKPDPLSSRWLVELDWAGGAQVAVAEGVGVVCTL